MLLLNSLKHRGLMQYTDTCVEFKVVGITRTTSTQMSPGSPSLAECCQYIVLRLDL